MGDEDREKGRRIGEALGEGRIWKSGGELLKVAASFGVKKITGVMLHGDEETIDGIMSHEVVEEVWVLDLGPGLNGQMKRAFVRDAAVAGVFGVTEAPEPGGDVQPDGEGGMPPDPA